MNLQRIMRLNVKKTLGFAVLVSVVSLFAADRLLKSQSIPLSADAQAVLAALNIPVAVPTYLPNGFSLSQIKVNYCPPNVSQGGECRNGSSYQIIYRNSENTCILVEAIGGGLGGPDSQFHYATQTDLLGEVDIRFGDNSGERRTPTQEQLTVPQPNLYNFPEAAQSASSPFYGVRVEENRYLCDQNRSISPLEFERVLQSLVLVN
ncbi:MAG: hypothetical protein ACRC8Y_20120 [Chroococcales cyanobacterium]